jgi:hypothetical protein
MSSLWWSRTWTLQEIVLPRESNFIYGLWRFDCRPLLSAKGKYEKHTMSCCAYAYHDSPPHLTTGAQGLMQKMNSLLILVDRLERMSLDSLTRMTSCRLSSEPRDTVYSLLGLMDPGISQKLTVDYTIASAHVFTETFRLLFTEGWVFLVCICQFDIYS